MSDGVAWPPVAHTLLCAAATTAIVTVLSLGLPPDYSNLGVAAAFLGATWLSVVRSARGAGCPRAPRAAGCPREEAQTIAAYGLSLGGLFEPQAIDWRRVARDAYASLGWVLLFVVVAFPPFAIGYGEMWAPDRIFVFRLPGDWLDRVAGQIVVIALPEEAFFRGYLQSALDGRWAARWRILGADLGPGWLVSCAIFALGHVLTIPHPGRLAVFFPALLFGWLRARTQGIGAGVLFHAACNLLSSTLEFGYGLQPG